MKISIKLKDIKRWFKGKERLMGVLGAAPVVAAATIPGSCAAGCPYGLVNDPYPGQCPRYIDVNGDGICDLSQTATTTETDSDTSTSSTDSSAEDTQTAKTDSPGNPDNGADQSTDTGAADPSNVTNASNVTSADDNGGFDLGDLLGDGGTGYHVIPLTMLIVGAYLFTHYLFTKGVLTPKRHKRIWNLLVTGGYLGTGVTGVLLIFMIKLGITALRQPTTFWHVELAVLMVIGTLIHIHIYRKPFKNMFKVLFGLGSSNTKNSRRDMRSSK